jgi:DNA helicase II / ATP-dependent DNA helicase PcrA
MSNQNSFHMQSVSSEDVAWVCNIMKLPGHAFSGAEGTDRRLEILKSKETLDIEACPGSGKTTLLVAKLAILARNWTDRCRGICVLSHTNVARREVEKRLGKTSEGKRLLSYPHFIGTIHAFVNEYLALPWLRSLGYPVKVIDNNHCEQHRRRLLKLKQFSALASYVNPKEAKGYNVVSKWCLSSPEFDVLKENGTCEFKDARKPAARQLHALGKKCLEDGYYRYDEMFIWAHNILDQVPEVKNAIRTRFPLFFIDEVQDNSELQSALLFRLFMEGDDPVVRQRYGDANQAIYQNSAQFEGATTDQFPDNAIRRDLPNSHRFGQEIGNLANPLALEPQCLVGCGPCNEVFTVNTTGKNTIFLFDVQTVQCVIIAYARYLLELFSEHELQIGTFTAIGGVHRDSGQEGKLPRSVCHYWPEYDYELTATEPRPRTFGQYVMAGRKLAHDTGEMHYVVEKIAEGILRLASIFNPQADLGNRRRKHRYILELLAEKPELKQVYFNLVTEIAVEEGNPTAEKWHEWAKALMDIAEVIVGLCTNTEDANEFMKWSVLTCTTQPMLQSRQRDNIFRYPVENPKLQIRVGSIHSVKGETHTATLLLDTFFYEHHLATLKPWLLREKSGKGNEGKRNLSRLKQHYVAMTRPSHLLCLAMREDVFTIEELTILKNAPWRVARVTESGVIWL